MLTNAAILSSIREAMLMRNIGALDLVCARIRYSDGTRCVRYAWRDPSAPEDVLTEAVWTQEARRVTPAPVEVVIDD